MLVISILFCGIEGLYVPLDLIVDPHDYVFHLTTWVILIQVSPSFINLIEVVIKLVFNLIVTWEYHTTF